MLRKLDSPEFLCLLGKLVLNFSSMEASIHTVIMYVSREGRLANALVPPNNSVSQNLDLLQRVCTLNVTEAALPHWISAISDLRELFNERNRIFHGVLVEEENKVILQRTLKGKMGKDDYYHDTTIDDQFLISLESRLSNRSQQLKDFFWVAWGEKNETEPSYLKYRDEYLPPREYPSLSF